MNEKESVKWFDEVVESKPDLEQVEIENNELDELTKICKEAFDKSLYWLSKRNPSDAKWLETALQKGTLRDRANSGALLFQSNPMGNLQALDVLIGLTKSSNKANTDVIDIVTELFIAAILPSDRKLVSLQQRCTQFRKLKSNTTLEKSYKEKVFMHWYFENELRDRYFTFLQNVESALRSGQDVHKNLAIVCVSKLLAFTPEKEQMLLSMLINKMGDPGAKVASKAQFHLIEVCHQHPNMCEVMVQAVDRFLFRPNLSERAQHVALTFLSEISRICGSKGCRKLVQVCFLFFKILVDKGMVNNRTMQAILRCLRRAVANIERSENGPELISKEMQDIIYRLVYFADIQISIQALGLLLQVFVPPLPDQNNDRFYTALYRKMVDIRLPSVTQKWAAQYLYIIHRAIALDSDIARAKAFTRRLLQMGLYLPSQSVCGVLIIVNKILLERPELSKISPPPSDEDIQRMERQFQLKTEDSDDEHYDDVHVESFGKQESKKLNKPELKSWIHLKIKTEKEEDSGEKTLPKKGPNRLPIKYDPFCRNPSGAGAQFDQILELIRTKEHFHPTVQTFVDCIIQNKKIGYYGDPLVDFSLTHFLDRFAFKNPKKMDPKSKPEVKSSVQSILTNDYKQFGSRGVPVTSLTAKNCTEDEKFIFQYLERRRQMYGEKKVKKDDDDSDPDDVDDDEFEAYLNNLSAKTSDDVDYMKEVSNIPAESTKGKKRQNADDEEEDIDDEWKEAEGSDEEESLSLSGEELSDMDLSDEDDDDDVMTFSSDDSEEYDSRKAPKAKKLQVTDKEFQRKIKHSTDMSSLFAAADDFGEQLEKTGKIKKHGTLDEVSNKDRSSEKQLSWEHNRLKSFSKSRKLGKTMLKTKSNKIFKKAKK